MSEYSAIIKKRNEQNTDWDTIMPITVADNVMLNESTSLADYIAGGSKVENLANMTLFEIRTVDDISGLAVPGINFKIVGTIVAPLTTNYTSNASGVTYVLLPYGTYTLTITDPLIGYDLTPLVFSSVSGDGYIEVGPIFVRSAVKKYTMASTQTYKKAPYITQIDAFLVGGGGTGGGAGASANWDGAGGGGGYTKTQLAINVAAYTEFSPVIGAGGSGWGAAGGQTSFLGYTANGGSPGGSASSGGTAGGGAGGSGGGGCNTTTSAGGAGGSNGSNGVTSTGPGGAGQGTTTKEFGEVGGTLYSGGGGGAEGGAGGAGGGGAGGNTNASSGSNGSFYGGGGGGACGGNAGSKNGGSGYKGCVVVRWV